MSAVVAVAVASSCCCIKIWLWVRLLFEAFTVSFQWCNNDLNWVMNLNVKVKKTALNAVKQNDNILRTEMLKLLVSPRPLIRAITCVVPEPIFPCAKRRTRVLPITPLIRRLRMFPLDVFLASILGSFLPRWVCALSSLSSKICISTNNKWAYTRKYIPNDDRIWNTLQKLRWSVLAAAQMEFKHLTRERKNTRSKCYNLPTSVSYDANRYFQSLVSDWADQNQFIISICVIHFQLIFGVCMLILIETKFLDDCVEDHIHRHTHRVCQLPIDLLLLEQWKLNKYSLTSHIFISCIRMSKFTNHSMASIHETQVTHTHDQFIFFFWNFAKTCNLRHFVCFFSRSLCIKIIHRLNSNKQTNKQTDIVTFPLHTLY